MKSISESGLTVKSTAHARSQPYIFPLASAIPAAIISSGMASGMVVGVLPSHAVPNIAMHSPAASSFGADLEWKTMLQASYLREVVERHSESVEDVPVTKRPIRVDRMQLKVRDRTRHIAMAEDAEAIDSLLTAHGY